MRHLLLISFCVAITTLALPACSRANVITFEEVGPLPIGQNDFTAQIDGVNFSPSINVINASNLFGHLDLAASAFNAGSLSPGISYSIELDGGGFFSLESAFFGMTHPFEAGSFVGDEVDGWRGTTQVFNQTFTPPQSPTQHFFDYGLVDLEHRRIGRNRWKVLPPQGDV